MRNNTWLRYGFFAALTLGGGAWLAACDGDDVVANNGTPDGGDDGTVTTDAGADIVTIPDATPDAPLPSPKLVIIHAANTLGPVRLCVADDPANANPDPTKGTYIGLAPLPSAGATPDASFSPGLPPGAGSSLPTAPLAATNTVVTLVSSAALVRVGAGLGQKTCDTLLKAGLADGGSTDGGTLVPNVDFWTAPPIPKGVLLPGKTYFLIITGCQKGLSGPVTATCGAGYDPAVGNLKEVVVPVDPAAPAGQMQFIHASSGASPLGPVIPYVVGAAPDAGIELLTAADAGATYADMLAGKATALKTLSTPLDRDGGGSGVLVPALPTDAGPTNLGPYPMALTTALSALGDPDPKGPATAYTLIAVGDPGAVFGPGGLDLTKFHTLLFSNNPKPGSL